MKQVIKFGLISLCLCGCSSREFESFGTISSDNVKRICESYAERVFSSKDYAQYVFLKYDLGVYDNSIYVDALNYSKEDVSFTTALVDIYVSDTYICSLPDDSYGLNVWIDGQGSYDIQTAYQNGKIDMDIINSVIEKATVAGLRIKN